MKQIITAIIAIIFIGNCAFTQTIHSTEDATSKKSKTEIMTHIASLPNVSVTYLTKSMLQKLPKDKAESPLAVLVNKGEMKSIRVFHLGSAESEAAGKRLIDAYTTGISEPDYAELLMLQSNESDEVIIYGFPIHNDTSYYKTVLMFSKTKGKKAILIILTGKIHEDVIGELIDSFSK